MVFATATRRLFASPARASAAFAGSASAPLRSSAWGPAIFGTSLLFASYVYYSSSSKIANESALKGDKQWADFKLVKVHDLSWDVSINC